jgi:flagellar assembly protein FliH
MTKCSEAATPVALSELEQLAPPPSLDPVRAAEQVIEAARRESETLRSQAVQDGFVEGLRRSQEESAASLAPALDALRSAMDEVVAARDEIVDEAEKRAVALAVSIAEKIVAGALEVQPERIVDVVRGALRGLLDSDRIVVCVHPDDVELLRLAGQEQGGPQIEIYAERRVGRGGALVRTSTGEIDARVATKLAAVQALVATELRA